MPANPSNAIKSVFLSPVWLTRLGFTAIIIAAILWAAAAPVASRLFQAGMKPFELAAARAVITAIGLAVIDRFGKPTTRRIDWRMVALGLSLAAVTLSYYLAIARLSVAVALVIQYTGPALVVIWMMLRFQRTPALSVVMALMAALVGVTLVAELPGGQMQLDSVGLIAAGLSSIFFASYTLLSESVVSTFGAVGVMFRAFSISSLFWIAFQLTQGFPQAVFVPQNIPGVLFVGIGGTLIPFCLYCWGIQYINSERGAIAATLEPVVGAILAWIWLGQSLSWMQMVGGMLVIGAVVSLQLQKPAVASVESSE